MKIDLKSFLLDERGTKTAPGTGVGATVEAAVLSTRNVPLYGHRDHY
jgi:hypothetical protein